MDADEVLGTTRAVRRRLDRTRDVPPELIRECVTLALQAPAKRALSHLDRAIEHNPWAAEPRIMRALCALESEPRAPR